MTFKAGGQTSDGDALIHWLVCGLGGAASAAAAGQRHSPHRAVLPSQHLPIEGKFTTWWRRGACSERCV